MRGDFLLKGTKLWKRAQLGFAEAVLEQFTGVWEGFRENWGFFWEPKHHKLKLKLFWRVSSHNNEQISITKTEYIIRHLFAPRNNSFLHTQKTEKSPNPSLIDRITSISYLHIHNIYFGFFSATISIISQCIPIISRIVISQFKFTQMPKFQLVYWSSEWNAET